GVSRRRGDEGGRDRGARGGPARDGRGRGYGTSDARHEIRASRMGRLPSTRFWSAEDAARLCPGEPKAGDFEPVAPAVVKPLQLSGLAVTTDHYLIVGRTQPSGVLVFDLRGGGAPLTLDWPTTVPFTPFDIGAASDGGAWILDRDARQLWRLDRFFRVLAAGPGPAQPWAPAFTPLSNLEKDAICPPPAPITSELALPLTAVEAPYAVEAL